MIDNYFINTFLVHYSYLSSQLILLTDNQITYEGSLLNKILFIKKKPIDSNFILLK